MDDRTTRIVDALDENGLAIDRDFISRSLVSALREETLALREEGGFRRAGVGRGETFRVDPTIRSDFVHWLQPPDLSTPQQEIWKTLEDLRVAINQRLYLGLFQWEGHLSVYPPGAFYARHLDRFHHAMHRTVSAILYLNENWSNEEGGELRIHTGPASDEFIDVIPRGGTLVMFLSDRFEHEVLPASRERLSLTGWFSRRA